MRKGLTYLLVIFGLIGVVISSGCGKGKVVSKIGVIIPLTGEWAPYGEQMKQGIDLAVEHANQAGGVKGQQISVIYEDGEAVPKKSIQAFNKLVNIDKVPAVISGFSGVVLSLAPQANKNEVVLLNCGATAPKIAEAGPFIFSNIPNANYEASFLAEYLFSKMSLRRVSIFWQNNDAGIGMRDVFKETFEKLGGKIIDNTAHEQGQIDFRGQLLQLSENKPEAVFMPTYSKEFGLILRQAKEINFNTKFIGYAATEVKDVLEIGGTGAEGIIYSYYSYDPETKGTKVEKFVVDFQKKFGNVPGLYSATFYDGAMLLFDALRDGAVKGTEIKEYLLKVKNYEGVSGSITFDGKTSVTMPLQIKTVKKGKFVKYEQ